jgi:NAD-specific glutamate dehydrogenase
MKRLTKDHAQRHAVLVERLHATQRDLERAIETYNEEASRAFAHVEVVRDRMQALLTEANEWLDEVRTDAQSYFDDRSEKWQESEAGEAYAEWISELETTLDEIEIAEPDALDVPDLDGIETFEGIRQGVDE